MSVAVVGDPSTGDALVAQRGRGTHVLGRGPVQADAASHVVVVEDGKSDGVRREPAADCLSTRIRRDEFDTRKLSSTLALAYMATGRIAIVRLWRP